MRIIRSLLGGLLILAGILLTILPGSTLLMLAGLVLICVDYKYPRKLLVKVQQSMATASRKLDALFIEP